LPPPLRAGEAAPQDDSRFFPFCNQRCKLADLHGWLTDRYVVSEQLPLDESEGLLASSDDE
jgi:endogenous inhibitor of DNA gyrase (YacG/DUF329 family)